MKSLRDWTLPAALCAAWMAAAAHTLVRLAEACDPPVATLRAPPVLIEVEQAPATLAQR